MIQNETPSGSVPNSKLIIAAVTTALFYSTFSGQIIGSAVQSAGVPLFGYAGAILAALSDGILLIMLVSLAAHIHPLHIWKLTGLSADFIRPLIGAVAILVPAALITFFLVPLSQDFALDDLLWKGIGGPIVEEIVYRGLAIGILMRLVGWPFWAASLLPALLFGAAHMWGSPDIIEVVGVVAITGIGGLLFGWLFVRWNFNLWPPIFLHIGLNVIWLVFDLGDNAMGGYYGNTMRLIIVGLAIGLTLRFGPRRKNPA